MGIKPSAEIPGEDSGAIFGNDQVGQVYANIRLVAINVDAIVAVSENIDAIIAADANITATINAAVAEINANFTTTFIGYRDNAAASAAAAAASADDAQASADAAAANVVNLNTAVATATTKAAEATASATAAANSATVSAGHVTTTMAHVAAADASKVAAAGSATAANASAALALTYRNAAQAAQTAAETARDTAITAKNDAQAAKTASEAARDTSVAQAGVATTKAGEAATSLVSVTALADATETSEDNAAASAALAEAARIAAEQARDEAEAVAGGDFLGKAGGTMTGKLNADPSDATSAGFNLGAGTAPDVANKVNGDVWMTNVGMFAHYNGGTVKLSIDGHTHTIAEVTGLQAALDAKAQLTGGNTFFGVQLFDDSISVDGTVTATSVVTGDVAYGAGWNGDFSTPTKNAVFDKFTTIEAAIAGRVDSALIGASNGIVPLGADTKIAAVYLPSYVDDVIEAANFAALPAVGEAGKIYVTIDTTPNKSWRWGGSVYVEIAGSPGSTDEVVEGAANLYFTTARVLGTLLAGLADTAGNIAATDSVLAAFGKTKKSLADLNSGKANLAGGNAFTGAQTLSSGHITYDLTGGYQLKIGGATEGWIQFVQLSGYPECHIRPSAGIKGVMSFTEDGVADRWSVGIKPGDAALYFSADRALGAEAFKLQVGTMTLTSAGNADLKLIGNTYPATIRQGSDGYLSISAGANTGIAFYRGNFAGQIAQITETEAWFLGEVRTLTADPYGSGWNGSLKYATKDAIYDKIESLDVAKKNKAPAISTIVTGATVTPTFSDDMVTVTGLAAALQLLNWTGTAQDGWGLVVRIKDNGTARALTYDTKYRANATALPTTTIAGKTLYLSFIYNAADDKFDFVGMAKMA